MVGFYKIVLERKNLWFWSGEEIEGMVEYHVTKSEHHYLGTCIRFNGISKTDVWEKYYDIMTDDGRKDVIEHSRAEEYIFSKWYGYIGLDDTQFTQGQLKNELKSILPIKLKPGIYYFEFKFRLPGNLPSIYKEDFGEISYRIECCPLIIKMNSPMIGDLQYKLNFFVLGFYDLSVRRGEFPYHMPRTVTEELGECFKVQCEITTDRHGYVYGQPIKAWGSITGRSYRNIFYPRVSLIMETVFRGKLGIEKIVTTVIQQEKLNRKNYKNWSFVFEGIPHNLPTTNLGGCQRNIKQKYCIRVNAHVELCACRSCKVGIATDNEVIIGTIPETWKKGDRRIIDVTPPPPIFYEPIRQYQLKRQIAPSKKFLTRPFRPDYQRPEILNAFGTKRKLKTTKRRKFK